MSSNPSTISNAMTNAKSRAAVIIGLDNSFMNTSKTSNINNTNNYNNNSSASESKAMMITSLQTFLNDNTDKTKSKLQEQLLGKSIVLENTRHLSKKSQR
jgi:hypothetical protein